MAAALLTHTHTHTQAPRACTMGEMAEAHHGVGVEDAGLRADDELVLLQWAWINGRTGAEAKRTSACSIQRRLSAY